MKFFQKYELLTPDQIKKAKETIIKYNNDLANNNEYSYIISLVKNMIDQRSGVINFDNKLSEIENAIKGELWGEQDLTNIGLSPLNVAQNPAALTIINNKASVFDVSNISVELKAKDITTDENVIDQVEEKSGETTTEVSDDRYIDIFNGILNGNYISKPEFKFCVADAIRYSRGYPMAVSMIGWDDNTLLGKENSALGDITFSNIPVQDFYWDPSSNSIENCEYVAVKKVLSYTNVEAFISQLKGNVELLEGAYITDRLNNVINSNNRNDITPTNQIENGGVELLTFYIKERKNKKVSIKLYHIVNQNYIVATQTYNIPYLPFAILKETSAPNAFWGISSVMLALPKLKQKTLVDAVITNTILAQREDVYIVNEASGINVNDLLTKDATFNGTKYLATNNTTFNGIPIQLVNKPAVNTDTLTFLNVLENEINTITSSTDITQVGSKLSGSAVQSVLNQATIQENNSVIELEKYLVRMVNILMSFIREKLFMNSSNSITLMYQPTTDTQLNKQNGKQTITLTRDMFDKFDGEVIIDASMLRTSKQLKTQQDLLSLFQLQAQYFGKADIISFTDIVRELNLPNKNAVIDRIKQQDSNVKLQQATQLVEGVLQLLQNPQVQQQYPDLTVEQAIQLLLAQQQGGK